MNKGVQVRFFAAARAAAGMETAYCASAPLSTILNELSKDNASLAHVISQCSFLLDSIAVHDSNVPVPNGSVIDVLPRFAGG